MATMGEGERVVSTPAGPVTVRVRTSARARRTRLVVRPFVDAELVVPAGASARGVERFLQGRAGWLGEARRATDERATSRLLGLDRPAVAWFDGAPLPVVGRPGAVARARLVDGVVDVAAPDALRADAALAALYVREARARLTDVVATEAERLELAPGRLSVRDTRSRWGSCSARGDLSFCWRLIAAPPPVLRYVVVHELCHLVVRDHSRRFWGTVEHALPDYRAPHAWLRRHGGELLAWQPVGWPEGAPSLSPV